MTGVARSEVLIVGAGFGGIATTIELGRHGITDVTLLEAGDGLGGTWMWNTYPGAACDVPSHLYSYSYEQRTDWTRLCSPQQEILTYIREIADRHGVTERVRTGEEVTSCIYSEAGDLWQVETASGGRYEAPVLVLATGQLNHPRFASIPGRDNFGGTSFHSARWDHEAELAGKDIAVIGTGASAVQFVPEIAKRARSVTVYQRTANWMMPRRNRAYPAPLRWLFEHVPGLQSARRAYITLYTESLTVAIRHPRTFGRFVKLLSTRFMRRELKGDPELAEKVWPDYTFGCKRVLFSSSWIETLRKPHVELVTDSISEITAEGVTTADGTARKADALIWATGFATTGFMAPLQITGRDGHTLDEAWSRGAHAHLGMTVPKFPSMFVMYGPNTNTSGGSILVYLEAQARYIRQAVELRRSSGAAAIEVSEEVERRSDEALQAKFAGTAWLDCDSWYRADGGRIVTNWPDSMRSYVRKTAQLDPADFHLKMPEKDRAPAATH